MPLSSFVPPASLYRGAHPHRSRQEHFQGLPDFLGNLVGMDGQGSFSSKPRASQPIIQIHPNDNTQETRCRTEESSGPVIFAQSVQYLSDALAIPKITKSFITKTLLW